MGNSAFKERLEKAEKTKILTADGVDLDDWDDVLKQGPRIGGCRTVSLAGNKLKKPVPAKFIGTPGFGATLRSLDLSKNGLADVSAFTCGVPAGQATDLQYALALARKRDTITPALPALEVLDLHGNSIVKLPPLFLAALPKLKKLSLQGNHLTDSKPGNAAESATTLALCFVLADSLTQLDLSANRLTTLPLAPRGDAPADALTSDDKAVCAAVWPLMRIEALNCSGNKISRATPGATFDGPFKPRPYLRSLSVANQACLDAVDPRLFALGKKLVDVDIDGNAKKSAMLDVLRGETEYKAFVEKRAGTVDRQLAAGVDATLAD